MACTSLVCRPAVGREAAAEALRFLANAAWEKYCDIMRGASSEERLAEMGEPYFQAHQHLVKQAQEVLENPRLAT